MVSEEKTVDMLLKEGKALARLAGSSVTDLELDLILRDLALVFSELKVLQPFRDMNTRTAMLFTVLLGIASGHYVDFTELEEERLSMTSIAYRDGNPDPVLYEFTFHTYDGKGLWYCLM